MPFDLENLNPGTRFPYPLPDDDTPKKERDNPKEWVEFRIADSDFLSRIRKDFAVKKREFVQPRKKSGKINTRASLQHVEYTVINDEDGYQEAIWDYMITGWDLKDAKGQDIPCTRENKNTLMRKSSDFAFYATECLDILRETEADEKEADTKNSKRS